MSCITSTLTYFVSVSFQCSISFFFTQVFHLIFLFRFSPDLLKLIILLLFSNDFLLNSLLLNYNCILYRVIFYRIYIYIYIYNIK